MYHDHLKFCVVCINGRRYVCCRECNVVSNECNEPIPCGVQNIGGHGGEVMYFGSICFRGERGFLICDDICMCVVNKQFELLEFVFDFRLCWPAVCELVLVSYVEAVVAVTVMCTVVCVACVYADRVRGCDGDGNAGVGPGGSVLAVSGGVYVSIWMVLCLLPTTC